MKRIVFAAVAFSLLLFATATLVGAWPNQPPTRATISGPGITGRVEISDPELLVNFKLGAIEDFDAGVVKSPRTVGEGYRITRYFDDFRFGLLTYYPGQTGERSYVFFEDGPDKEGDRTAYDRQWLYATPQGQVFLKALVEKLATPAGGSPAGQPQAPSGNSTEAANGLGTASLWLVVVEAAVAISAGLIAAFLLRRRTGAA